MVWNALPKFPKGKFRCSTCKKLKSLKEFDKNKGYKYGHHYNCKICRHKFYKKSYYKNKYGLDFKTLKKIKEKQNFKCKLCGKKRKLVVDHNHKTGKIRGLLCYSCNVRLGWYENRKNKVFKYLEE